MLKAAIFDADGTLLNSMTFWQTMVNSMLISMGCTPRSDLTEDLTPLSMTDGARFLKAEYGIPLTVDEIVERENNMVRGFYFNDVETRPNTRELLERLYSMGVPMTVASATDRNLIVGALEHLGIRKYFKEVFSCTDVGESKSSPKIFLEACRCMDSVPSETLVAEDSLQGITTAKRAGFLTLGLYDVTQKAMWSDVQSLSDMSMEGAFDVDAVSSLFAQAGEYLP